MTTLPELIAQRDALAAQITLAQAAARHESVAAVRALMAQLGVTLSDLASPGKQRANGGVAPKYRNAAGQTWSGRGFRPVWLRDAIAAGATLDQFAIVP